MVGVCVCVCVCECVWMLSQRCWVVDREICDVEIVVEEAKGREFVGKRGVDMWQRWELSEVFVLGGD